MHDSQLDTSADDCIAPETITENIEKHNDEPSSALVLCLYLLALDRGDKQPPSQRALIERTGISPGTVREQLDTLRGVRPRRGAPGPTRSTLQYVQGNHR